MTEMLSSSIAQKVMVESWSSDRNDSEVVKWGENLLMIYN